MDAMWGNICKLKRTKKKKRMKSHVGAPMKTGTKFSVLRNFLKWISQKTSLLQLFFGKEL
jgi:hypothetical protein